MAEALLRAMFDAAVEAAQPAHCVAPYLPPQPRGRTVIVGAGKAAASMARAIEISWPNAVSGLIVTRYGHGVPCQHIEVVEAAHPVPDAAGQLAAMRILAMVQDLGDDDLVLCLMSGGGSALLSLPAPGLTLDEKRAVNTALLRSGATISEINCVRKHLSAIKGGRLAAAAYPARVVTLAISDVAGDDPAVIASGPTVADPTTFSEALAVIEKYDLLVPAAVRDRLRGGAEETPKPGDPRLQNTDYALVARPADALAAAAEVARAAGFTPIILGDAIEGEARAVAQKHADVSLKTGGPAVILSGGETTVTVHGDGRGGPNGEFMLALALALDGQPNTWAIACDTDGIDGSEDNAGYIARPDTLMRARKLGLDPVAFLIDNDSHGFFLPLGDLVITGPTHTNVNDFRAILINAP